MSKPYETPVLTVLTIDSPDVLTTSGVDPTWGFTTPDEGFE